MIQNVLIVLNLVVLESLLSVDNVAVLALMVKHLPEDKQKKALTYGMWGAFGIRGLCLFMVSWLMSLIWLKILGGLYLVYLCYGHFSSKVQTAEEDKKAGDSALYRWLGKLGISVFVSTIVLVEFMDLVFSVDNVFAAVAMSSNYYIVLIGVILGILAIRLVATWFLSIMKKYPSLEKSAFIVIGCLGIKLMIAGLAHYLNLGFIESVMKQHWFDLAFSVVMLGIFIKPILSKNYVFRKI